MVNIFNSIKKLFNNSQKNEPREKVSSEQKESKSLTNTPIGYQEFDKIVSISSLNFHGLYNYSRNKLWVIAWSDSYNFGDKVIGGFRESGNGKIVLYNKDNNNISFVSDQICRPSGCTVSNTGISCIVDLLFTNQLINNLYVFNATGSVLLKREVTANIYNSQISSSGKYIVFQTANSKTDDGNKLTLIDVENEKTLFTTNATYGWSNSYKIDDEQEIVYVTLNEHKDKYRYNFNGEMIDKEKFTKNILTSDNYSSLIFLVEDLLKNSPNKENLLFIIEQLTRIEAIVKEENQSYLPFLYKNLGTAYELSDNKKDAIKFYQQALELDPKIGVKRKLTSLLK